MGGEIRGQHKWDPRLRKAVDAVLSGGSFRNAAQSLKVAIRETDGLTKAADIIERVLSQTAVV